MLNYWRQTWRVDGRESGSPELLESPRTSPEVPRTSPEFPRRLPRKFLSVWNLTLGSVPPRTASPGPFGPGTPEKSRKSPPSGPPRRPERERPQSLKRVRKESERTLLGLFSDFGTWGGPAPGDSFGTLLGLLRGCGGRPCAGRGRSQI